MSGPVRPHGPHQSPSQERGSAVGSVWFGGRWLVQVGSSDLDFLVDYLPEAEGHYDDAYFGLLFDLERFVPAENRPCRGSCDPKSDQIPEHRRIIAFRNLLAHGYDSVDHEVVWLTIANKLLELLRHVETLLAALP